MSTTLVPSSIIGKVFILGPLPANSPIQIQCSLAKIGRTDGYQYWECLILHYMTDTGEILLRLDNVTNSIKWFDLWYSTNKDWVAELNVKYIFIE